MPIKKSAFKELRKAKRRTAANAIQRKQLKDAVKKFGKSIAKGERDAAAKLAAESIKLLDRAAKKRRIHPNKAARKKSRLLKALRSASTSP